MTKFRRIEQARREALRLTEKDGVPRAIVQMPNDHITWRPLYKALSQCHAHPECFIIETLYQGMLEPAFTPLDTIDQQMLAYNGSNGQDTFTFAPDFRLYVPASTYQGSYGSTMTATYILGP